MASLEDLIFTDKRLVISSSLDIWETRQNAQ